jgi:hypothetical protein
MYEAENKASQDSKVMFYTVRKEKRWHQPNSPPTKTPHTSKPSEVEAMNKKSSKFAKIKTTEYIRNTRQVYYLDRRLFF